MAITQGTWGNLFGPLSNIDFGITERLSGGKGGTLFNNPNQTQQGQVQSAQTSGPVATQTGSLYGPQPVSGPQYSGPASSGGGGAAPVQQNDQGAPMEQAPAQPSIDFDSIIRPALDALGQAETAAQSIFSAGEAEAEATRTNLTGRAEQQLSQSQQDLAKREASEKQRGQSAIDEQRRGFSEIQQGLQARFGSGVSTGSAAAGILGAETLRNISGVRTALQTSLNEIETTKQGVNDLFNQQIKEIEANTTAIKAQARAGLQQALAEIGSTRGQLQSRKAELVMETMQRYQQQVADVNARNTAFQQQLYAQKQAAEQQLAQAQATAAQRLSQLEPFSINAGETRFVPLQQFGGQEGFENFSGTQLPGGVQTGIQGPYGVISSPGKSNDLENPFE